MKKLLLLFVVAAFAPIAFNTNAQIIVDVRKPCDDLVPGTFCADAIYCAKYYICNASSTWVAFSCPPGLEFNELTNTCDIPGLFTHHCGCYL